VTDAELNQAKARGTTLLGFNEPDMAGQANMTVERALELSQGVCVVAPGHRAGQPGHAPVPPVQRLHRNIPQWTIGLGA
jgi:hypothetical protein